MVSVDHLATTDPLGQNGLFAVFSNQTYCPVQVPSMKCERSPQSWPTGVQRFVQFKNTTLRLGVDRKVYDSHGDLWPELSEAEVLDMAVIPKYDVFN